MVQPHTVYMCTKLNLEDLARHRLALLKTYGSATAKKWKQFVFDTFLVASGVKRAWLVDYFQPDAAQLRSVLADVLRQEPNLNGSNLCAVSINEDLLVLNIEGTLSVCEELLQTTGEEGGSVWTRQHDLSVCAGVHEFVVLDCSGSQHCASVSELAHILTELLPVATALKEKLSAFKCPPASPGAAGPDTMCIPHVVITVTEDVNLCTLFGWLLGYPFVYWFPHSNGGSEVGLSMVPLTCYKVCYNSTNEAVTSSSTCNRMKMEVKTVDSNPLVLYSFSVPASIFTAHTSIAEVVQKWFRTIKDRTLKLLDVTIQLQTTSVALPHVIL